MYTNTYFFIFILCLNTMTSMINTNVLFDFTDFQGIQSTGTDPAQETLRFRRPLLLVVQQQLRETHSHARWGAVGRLQIGR